jgi:hypothetical protein
MKNKRCVFYFSFAALTPITAKLYLLLNFFPFFAPCKRFVTCLTNFDWQMLFFHFPSQL